MTTLPVNIRIGAIDRLSNVLSSVSGSLEGVRAAAKRTADRFAILQANTKGFRDAMTSAGGTLKSIGSTMTTRISAPIGLAGAAMIKTAASFEKEMNKVRAVANPTAEDFKKLREQAKFLGGETKFSANQAAQAMTFLGMAGFDTQKIMGAMPGVLDLAAASNMDLGRTADIVAAALNQFKLPASDAIKVADVLTRVTVGAAVDMEDLAEAMKYAGPVAQQFGASLEDTAAAAGLLGNIGIKGSQAGTTLKNVFLSLTAPTGATKKAIKTLGLQIADSQGKVLPFVNIMKQVGEKLGKLPQQAKLQYLSDLFGMIGIAGGSALADMAKVGDLEKFIKTMGDTSVTAKKVAAVMNEGAVGAMDELTSAFENLAITIADSGILTMFTDTVKDLTNFVRKMAEASPATFRWGVAIAAALAVLGPLILLMGQFAVAIPAIISAFTAMSAVTAIAFGKLALIALAIGAVIAAGIYLYENWEAVKEYAGRVWNAISILLDSHLGKIIALHVPFIGIPALIYKYWEPLKKFFGDLWDAVTARFQQWMAFNEQSNKAVAEFVNDMMSKFDEFKLMFKPLWDWVYQNFFSKFESAMKMVSGAVDTIKGIMPDEPLINKIPGGKEFMDNLLPDVGAMKDALFGSDKAEPGTGLGPLRPAPTPTMSEKKNMVEVIFKNPPDGTKIQSDSKSDDFFNVRTGLQGAFSL